MNLYGLTDSIAGISSDRRACARCGTLARFAHELCVGCFLQPALEGEGSDGETFAAALAALEVPDNDWRLGHYQILEEIGRGGMGVIYRARQRHSRRIVALKRILSYHADSQETLARFRREAEAAASLDHPNILPIYEVGEGEDGLPFFSMKYATGGSLLEAAPALRHEPRRAVALLAKIARAVQHAHLQGILHRDLKPGNILLDLHGEPLVSDFGLAKWLDVSSELTRTLTIYGTPGFIAPEQARGARGELTPAADVYSLGAILFDLLAGRPPFIGEHALAVIQEASEKPAPKLRTLAPTLDRDLETICAKCLEREAQLRYRSAGELGDDLERWLEGRPILARPVAAPVRVWRWSKRNPVLAGSLLAVVVLSVVGLAATITSSRLWSSVQRAESAQRSVVVLPVEDLDEISTDSNSAQTATSAFLVALSHANGIHLSPASNEAEVEFRRADDWKALGRETGARFILSANIRQRKGRKQIVARLIEAETGSAVNTWMEEATSASEFAAASVSRVRRTLDGEKVLIDTSGRISSADATEVNAVGQSKNRSARSYCERGEEFFFRYNLSDLARAIDSFRKATAIDPNYAVAQAMLASACAARAQVDPGGAWLAEAEVAAAAALRIAPLLPESHRARAAILRRQGQLWESIDSVLTAFQLDPDSGRTAAQLGDIYEQLGRPDLAIGWFEKAVHRQVRPLFADNVGNAWTSLGDYDKAEAAYQAAIVFRPDLSVGLLGLSEVALLRGDYEKARMECEKARAAFPRDPQPLRMAAWLNFVSRRFPEAEKLYREAMVADRTGGVNSRGAVRYISALGFIENLSEPGTDKGRALLDEGCVLDRKELESAPDNLRFLYSLAASLAALGERDAALTALSQAIAAGWIDHHSLGLDPRFDSIRNDARFHDIFIRLTAKVEAMRRPGLGRTLVLNAE